MGKADGGTRKQDTAKGGCGWVLLSNDINMPYQSFTTYREIPIISSGMTFITGADVLLVGEANGMASDFTRSDGTGYVSVKDTSTLANNLSNVSADTFWTNEGTSPKLVNTSSGTLVWSPHNMFVNSGTPATQNVTLIIGATYTITVTGAGGGNITGSSGASGTATTGSPATFTATGTTGTFTLTGSLDTIQLNRGTVGTAYLATTGSIRIGCAIDYDIAELAYGLLVETTATNLALQASDFTDASWTKSNMTTALTSTGPDGVANSASRLTATAGNATALQSITSASAARISSVYLKRITGSGNIDITQDNGGTWTTVSITNSWARYSLPLATLANPIVGIRIVTSGDAVDAALFQHETNPDANIVTSPIPTFTVPVTRAADKFSKALTAIPFSTTEGTVYIKATARASTGAGYWNIRKTVEDFVDSMYLWINSNVFTYNAYDSTGTPQAAIGTDIHTPGTRYQISTAWKVDDYARSIDGAAPRTDTSGTIPVSMTLFRLGLTWADSQPLNGNIKKLVYVPRRVTDSDLPTWRYIVP